MNEEGVGFEWILKDARMRNCWKVIQIKEHRCKAKNMQSILWDTVNGLIWLECSTEKSGEISKNQVEVQLSCLDSVLQAVGEQLKGLDWEFLIKLCGREVILALVWNMDLRGKASCEDN